MSASRKSAPKSSRTRSAKSKVSAKELQGRMTFLQSSLPYGFQNIFSLRRAGKGYGMATSCPYCDERPPHGMFRTDLRRRWQVAHLAVKHIREQVKVKPEPV